MVKKRNSAEQFSVTKTPRFDQCTMLPAQYIESANKHVLNGHDGLAMVSYAIGEDATQFSASNSHYLSQNS